MCSFIYNGKNVLKITYLNSTDMERESNQKLNLWNNHFKYICFPFINIVSFSFLIVNILLYINSVKYLIISCNKIHLISNNTNNHKYKYISYKFCCSFRKINVLYIYKYTLLNFIYTYYNYYFLLIHSWIDCTALYQKIM